jgi:hypothetical protein
MLGASVGDIVGEHVAVAVRVCSSRPLRVPRNSRTACYLAYSVRCF